ncbi:MAG: HNH endonuclease [Bacteroidetes bacterium B1(2017)]|nr:MAG: HNH endonuclease [Bacteroidetes bacterium B1(2017)]
MRNPKWHRDEIILALDLYHDKNLGSIDSRNPKIIELSKLLNKLPIFDNKPDQQTFRNPNGVTLKLSNFKAIDPNYGGKGMNSFSKLDKEVFEEFSSDIKLLNKIANEIKKISTNSVLSKEIANIENDDLSETDSVKEGQVLYKLHKVRERDRKIIDAKKKRVIKEKGELRCEACNFNFETTYGELGKGYIECHHLIPLANFQENKVTKLEDLALLCSNCHSMIHRDLNISSIIEFKKSIKT